jgi:hypothetical protein
VFNILKYYSAFISRLDPEDEGTTGIIHPMTQYHNPEDLNLHLLILLTWSQHIPQQHWEHSPLPHGASIEEPDQQQG